MKKIFILLLVLLMISTPVFADEVLSIGFLLTGLVFTGIGGGLWALSDGDPVLETSGVVILGLGGGGCLLLALITGIIEMLAEAETPPDGLYLVNSESEASTEDLSLVSYRGTGSTKMKDSIFNHLLLGTNGKSTYLGVHFSW